VRVIAGTAKGRSLKLDKTANIRPTSDKLKEALFSTIGPLVQDKRVLDLFAGSGALGIEALSRGAAHATFVDVSRTAISLIRLNLQATKLIERATVLPSEAERFARTAAAYGPFDLVFVDPPYSHGFPTEILAFLREGGALSAQALVVVEASSKLGAYDLPSGYVVHSDRTYGDSRLLYLPVTNQED
jgi:16S rRNA (guanine966-N2)-methyltransferase